MDEAADHAASMPDDQRVSAFELAQERSQLARDLKEIYDSMRQSGAVYLRINKYIEVRGQPNSLRINKELQKYLVRSTFVVFCTRITYASGQLLRASKGVPPTQPLPGSRPTSHIRLHGVLEALPHFPVAP